MASKISRAWLRRLQPATVRAITDQTSGLLALAQSREDLAHA